jgi:hypothetical protein
MLLTSPLPGGRNMFGSGYESDVMPNPGVPAEKRARPVESSSVEPTPSVEGQQRQPQQDEPPKKKRRVALTRVGDA